MSRPVELGGEMPAVRMASPAVKASVPSPGMPSVSAPAPSSGRATVVPVVGAPGVSSTRRLTLEVVAAADVSGHRVVTPLPDGSVRYAGSNRMMDRWAPLWITVGAAVKGHPVEVVTRGPIEEPTWSWNVGPVYLAADGQLTQATPSRPAAMFVAQVGTATSPTSVFVDRFQSVVLA